MERLCISTPELAKRLGISRGAAYNLVNSEGFYPAFRMGKRVLVNLAALDRWLEERTRTACGMEAR